MSMKDLCRVTFLVIQGPWISHLVQHMYLIEGIRPDIILLDIGSNDLCSKDVRLDKFVANVTKFIHQCLGSGVRKLVPIPVWFRSSAQLSRALHEHDNAVSYTNVKFTDANVFYSVKCAIVIQDKYSGRYHSF